MDLESSHAALTRQVAACLAKGAIPFVVGGGNDQSYPNASALLAQCIARGTSMTVINVDAHLDVRPLRDGLVHSGSPFRLLLEDARWSSVTGHFIEFAAQGSQCSAAHVDYLACTPRTNIVWLLKHLRAPHAPSVCDQFAVAMRTLPEASVFVSFDIDSIAGEACPGVSCPATIGLSAEEALAMCLSAGTNPQVQASRYLTSFVFESEV
jgi:formiminoglutamase